MIRRRIGLAIAAAALLIAGIIERPHADLKLLMHESRDPTPNRMQAALNIGVVAVSVLVTWTRHPVDY